jgi:meiotically up-regulated gene 157 (Mug157) protein
MNKHHQAIRWQSNGIQQIQRAVIGALFIIQTFWHSQISVNNYKRTISCSNSDSICYYFKTHYFFLHISKTFSKLEVKWTGSSEALIACNEVICDLRQNEFHFKAMRAADVYVCGHKGRGCYECHNYYSLAWLLLRRASNTCRTSNAVGRQTPPPSSVTAVLDLFWKKEYEFRGPTA